MGIDRKNLIKESCDFIAQIEKGKDSLVWNATWIASKNRFLSPLNPLLEAVWNSREEPKFSYVRLVRELVISILKLIKFNGWLLHKYFLTRVLVPKQTVVVGPNPVLIKSFAYRHSFSSDGFSDVFFGDLPAYLHQNKFTCFTVVDPIDSWRETTDYANKNQNFATYLQFLRLTDFVWVWWQLLREMLVFRNGKQVLYGHDLSKTISKIYLFQLLNTGTFHSLIFYCCFARLSRIANWKYFYLTAENNSWEKMAIAAIRSSSPETKIIGYQHTVVTLSSLNMFKGEGEVQGQYFPDRIVTVGLETAKMLNSLGNYPDFIQIRPGCALRYAHLQQKIDGDLPHELSVMGKNLLIAFEAGPGTEKLLDYVIHNQDYFADWSIKGRPHPALAFEDIVKLTKNSVSLLRDFSVSRDSSLASDLAWADIVLYWGSTVSLEALALGKPVVHLDYGNRLSYDPLSECNDYKWTLSFRDSPVPVMEEILRMTKPEREKRIFRAKEFLRSFFYPVTEENLRAFLNE